jgi:patatin-like phospholipase/acyl hydrolase
MATGILIKLIIDFKFFARKIRSKMINTNKLKSIITWIVIITIMLASIRNPQTFKDVINNLLHPNEKYELNTKYKR